MSLNRARQNQQQSCKALHMQQTVSKLLSSRRGGQKWSAICRHKHVMQLTWTTFFVRCFSSLYYKQTMVESIEASDIVSARHSWQLIETSLRCFCLPAEGACNGLGARVGASIGASGAGAESKISSPESGSRRELSEPSTGLGVIGAGAMSPGCGAGTSSSSGKGPRLATSPGKSVGASTAITKSTWQ